MDDFSLEEPGRRAYKTDQYEQGNPCNFEDFGFHSFTDIG
jgi:hypothetical protein